MSSNSSPRTRVGLFIDLENIRHSLEAAGFRPIDGPDLGARIYSFASTRGRVVVARAYGDWTQPRSFSPRDFRRQQIEPKFVMCRDTGPPPVNVTMSLDVQETLFGTYEVDEYILVSGDGAFGEVLQRLHRFDRDVVVCGIRSAAAQELIRAADHFVPLEDVLLLPPASPTPREPFSQTFQSPGTDAYDEHDVTALILLISRLEERLDFVGVGYLIGKAMGHNAVGPEDIRLRRTLFNRLADEGIVEVYKLDNKEIGADPVSACRLDRSHPRVVEVLATSDDSDDFVED